MFPLFRYGEPCVEECASSGKIKWSHFLYIHDIHDVRFSLKIQERITFGAPLPALGISAPRRQPPLFKTFLRWIHKFVKEKCMEYSNCSRTVIFAVGYVTRWVEVNISVKWKRVKDSCHPGGTTALPKSEKYMFYGENNNPGLLLPKSWQSTLENGFLWIRIENPDFPNSLEVCFLLSIMRNRFIFQLFVSVT